MNEHYTLKTYLPIFQSFLVYGIHYLYLMGLYILFRPVLGDTLSLFHGSLYLTGLFVLCLIRKKYLTNLILIISGILIFFTGNTLFFYLSMGLVSGAFYSSMIMLIGFAYIDIKHWKKKQFRSIYMPMWYFIAEPIVLYIYGAYKHADAYKIVALFLLIFWAMTHFISEYLRGMERFFDINKDVEGTPRVAMFKANTKILSLIMGIMFGLLLLSVFFNFDGVFTLLVKGALYVVAGLVALVALIMLWLERMHILPPGFSERIQPYAFPNALANSRWFWIWEILGNLLCLFILAIFIRNAVRYFGKKLEENEKVEEEERIAKVPVDVVETIDAPVIQKKNIFRTNREKVRDLFSKKVRKIYKNAVPGSMTAHELLPNEGESEKTKNKNLTTYYDVARYSEHEISNKDLNSIK